MIKFILVIQIDGFPGVVGAIDGTYIDIRTPAGKLQSTYINRHDKPPLTLQGICDANYRFIDCFTGTSSRIHDSRIFKLSFIYPLIHELGNYHIIGDSAYGISKNVMTPFRDYGNLNNNQENYNFKLSATRVKIENAFVFQKLRFRHLIRCGFKTVEKAARFILCCCVLHNLCIENDFLFQLPEIVEINNFNDGYPRRNERADKIAGEMKRNNLAENFHN